MTLSNITAWKSSDSGKRRIALKLYIPMLFLLGLIYIPYNAFENNEMLQNFYDFVTEKISN